jgi:uncharacterized cupin superfamily protein
MKKAQFDPDKATVGASYPPPHNEKCQGRKTWALTRQYGLTQFGVNRVELQNRSDKIAIYYDIGGRDMYDVSTFPDAGFQAKPHFEIRFRPLKA